MQLCKKSFIIAKGAIDFIHINISYYKLTGYSALDPFSLNDNELTIKTLCHTNGTISCSENSCCFITLNAKKKKK